MKRQGMTLSIDELRDLADDLEKQCRQLNLPSTKFLVNIINKTPECSDTWEIEK